MGLRVSGLYAVRGTLLALIAGPRGDKCELVGRPELELAGGT